MAAPIIRIDGISKSFGPLKVLDGLSMEVMPGEKLALIGPSGSGKTTILRILMTLERIDGGHIEVDGEQLYHMQRNGQLAARRRAASDQDARRRSAWSSSSSTCFRTNRVLDNVTLAPMLTKGTPRAAAEKRAMELLDMVGMADKAKAMPAQLSGGQKQRVAIARALALSAEDHAVRRGDLGARSRTGRGGAERHAPARRRDRHDHAAGHPRDGLRP